MTGALCRPKELDSLGYQPVHPLTGGLDVYAPSAANAVNTGVKGPRICSATARY